MAKKNRKNLRELAAKRQTLQALIQGQVIETEPVLPTPPQITDKELSSPQSKVVAALPEPTHVREITRTAISVAIIAVLLIGLTIFDHQRPFLDQLGSWLYKALRLQS